MTASLPNSSTARRKRTILCGCGAQNSAAARALHEVAEERKAELICVQRASDFLLALESAADTVCVATLHAEFPEVVACARAVAQKVPLSEIVIFATAADQERLGKMFGFPARLGNHFQYLEPESAGLVKRVSATFQRADLRRSTRTTLDRFNARLTVQSEAVDAKEMRQLVISDRFLYSVLESAFDAVLLVDRAGIVVAFNPSAEALFERTQGTAMSHPVWTLGGERWRADTLRFADAGNGPSGLIHSAVETPNGVKDVEISATPVYDRNQSLTATSLIVRDVTRRIQSEQALRTNEKLAAVGRLASSIAHEINNPLEAVTNLLYLARHSQDMPEVQSFLALAELELRRMSVITSQTLRFHKQSVGPVEVMPAELLDGVLGVYQARFVNSDIALERRERGSKAVMCLEGEIRQVLNNLVGNAIDAMHGMGGRLLLRSREGMNWRSGDRGVFFTVADTGGGMSEATAKKVFEPFFTTKGESGTGLGLWISHEIVARHHGELRVRSRQPLGTVFSMFLPFEG